MRVLSSARHVAILGAGPAGLTAAIYAARALLAPVVFEKGVPGGQLNETDLIENWPGTGGPVSARDLMAALRRQAEELGTEIVAAEVTALEPGEATHRVVTTAFSVEARAVIVCPGARPREIRVPGAERLKGRGVSYCATCDGYFFRDRPLVVLGAGDAALTEALFLTRFASRVSVVVRHPESDPRAVRASATVRRRAEENPKIEFLWNRSVEEIVGDASVTGLRLRRLDTGEIEEVPADGVFVSIGRDPQTGFLGGVLELEDGYIVTDERMRTNVAGVFAAGDGRLGARAYSQAIVAAGEGAVAALEAERYVLDELVGVAR